MRILGIDYGEVRVGVAACDVLGILAHPVETIFAKHTDPVARIADIARSMSARTVVVGHPLRISGQRGTAAEKAEAFADKIKAALGPDFSVVLHDERLTTSEAQRQLHEAGRNTKNSRHIIDQAAATVILQNYLDSLSGPHLLTDPDGDENEEDQSDPA